MTHERSRTIEKDGKYYNVSGLTGKVLRPMFHYERPSYSNEREAVRAAEKRSRDQGYAAAAAVLVGDAAGKSGKKR